MDAKKIVEKNKKYIFQFPEETPTEKQAEYLNKLTAKLETEQFVAVDPKIKIFDAKIYEEVKDHVDAKDNTVPAEPSGDATAKEQTKSDEVATTEKNATTQVQSSSETTIEKVDVPSSEPAEEQHPLMNE